MSLFNELKRRNVFKVGIAYAVGAWVLLQIIDLVLENINAPDWVMQTFMLALAIGFPLAVFFAWAFEMTPDGIKKEKDVDRTQSITPQTGQKLNRGIILILALAVVYFVYDKLQAPEAVIPVAGTETVDQTKAPADVEPVHIDPSIAVLPFADLSPEKDQGYFSDGISEELLNLLVRVDGLKVASRTSSFTYKGSSQSLAEIATELKVDHVLEGSVRKADNRIRITAQLIDAKTDRHLWSETFDRDLVDIFAIQDEIANAIVESLRTELGMLQDAPAISVTADTADLDAYELYLKARGLFIARDKLEESIALFEKAVELDPEFARAWEGLAAVYSVAESWSINDREYTKMSLVAARKALDINPGLSMPYAVLGSAASEVDRDMIKSIEQLDQAIDANSKNTTAYLWRSIVWASLGFFDKAIEDADTCLEVDPNYENCRRHLAIFHLTKGNSDLALELFELSAERGFYGGNKLFANELIKRGHRLAATLGVWQLQLEDRSYPAEIYLDALEFPQQDHSGSLAKFLHWVKSSATYDDPESWVSEMLALGGFEYIAPKGLNNSWIWQEQNQDFRQSEYFKPLVHKLGLYKYWRLKGFPPQCSPVGEDDFECH